MKCYKVIDSTGHFHAVGTTVYKDDQALQTEREAAEGAVLMCDHMQFPQALLPHQFVELPSSFVDEVLDPLAA